MGIIIERVCYAVESLREVFSIQKHYDSYYPELPHKNAAQKLLELMHWFLKYGEANKNYYLYGFDISAPERNAEQYMDLRKFNAMLKKSNLNGKNESQVVILRDKYLFYRYMQSLHIPVPEVFAVYMRGKLFDNELNPLPEEMLKGKKDYFIKAIGGQCGIGVSHILDYNDCCRVIQKNKNQDFILQNKVIQHPELDRMNPGAVNTIRIVTVLKEGKPTVFSSFLRIGTVLSRERDNTSQGGIAVGIEQDGTLMMYGVRKPEFGGMIDHHPDTNVVFAGFKIPHYQEALKTACLAHEKLYRIRSVGWDIAITEDGCAIIEGNDNWELQTIQGIYGGMRDKCDKLLAV